MSDGVDLHTWKMTKGKHAGEPITRVPVSYLRWMVNVRHGDADVAAAEMKRRGTVVPTLEISGHAIDRASLLCRFAWHEHSNDGEGLHAWLVRASTDALEQGKKHPTEAGRISWLGLSWRFEMDCEWPVLKTVLPINAQKGKRRAEKARRAAAS